MILKDERIEQGKNKIWSELAIIMYLGVALSFSVKILVFKMDLMECIVSRARAGIVSPWLPTETRVVDIDRLRYFTCQRWMACASGVAMITRHNAGRRILDEHKAWKRFVLALSCVFDSSYLPNWVARHVLSRWISPTRNIGILGGQLRGKAFQFDSKGELIRNPSGPEQLERFKRADLTRQTISDLVVQECLKSGGVEEAAKIWMESVKKAMGTTRHIFSLG